MLRAFRSRRHIRPAVAVATVTIVFATLLVAGPAPAGAQTGSVPVGYLDVARATGGGVEVAGWTYDPDAPASSNWVHVYVDGAFVGELRAGGDRPDVNAAFGVGGRHGFGGVVAGGAGSEVCVYGLGLGPDGRYDAANALLEQGCRVVGGAAPAPAPAPTSPPAPTTAPIGYTESVESDVFGGLEVAGWTYDPDDPSRSLVVHIYLDGVFVGETIANQIRTDVNAALGIEGAHGFRTNISLDLGLHRLCVYALGVDGSGRLDGVNPNLTLLVEDFEGLSCFPLIFAPPECEQFFGPDPADDAATLACVDDYLAANP